MSRPYVIQSGSSRRKRPAEAVVAAQGSRARRAASTGVCEDGSVETRLPVDAGPGRSSLRGLDRVRGRASSKGAGSHRERIPLARFFATITSGKSKSVLWCFRHDLADQKIPQTSGPRNGVRPSPGCITHLSSGLYPPMPAKKEKGGGGQRNPLKRLKMDKGIKGDQSLFLG